MSGAVRCVCTTNARNHDPRSARNRTGEVDELVIALGLSFPRGESPIPHTKLDGSTACSASYAAASARPQTSADWFVPATVHCGLTKYAWLHSFMTTNWCTVGNVRATSAVHAAKRWMRTESPH